MIHLGRRLMKKRSELIEYQNSFCKQTALDSEIMKLSGRSAFLKKREINRKIIKINKEISEIEKSISNLPNRQNKF